MKTCPVCLQFLVNELVEKGSDCTMFECHNCGNFGLSRTMITTWSNNPLSGQDRAKLSYAFRRGPGGRVFTSYDIESILKTTSLPDAAALVDNLLLHVSTLLPAPGETTGLWAAALAGTIGALNPECARWAIKQALSLGYLEGQEERELEGRANFRVGFVALTSRGWARAIELQRSSSDSGKAFMAMQFKDDELDDVFLNCFKPAVAAAGFVLERLDEAPRAGLIDDRLRVEIRTSRFVIADLTHGNRGAYWEAGYGEGLGRPVIYTCKKKVFDSEVPVERPHFDTNHHQTVKWDPENLEAAKQELTAVIRATFPADAKLE